MERARKKLVSKLALRAPTTVKCARLAEAGTWKICDPPSEENPNASELLVHCDDTTTCSVQMWLSAHFGSAFMGASWSEVKTAPDCTLV